MTAFVLNMTEFVLNMTVLVLNMISSKFDLISKKCFSKKIVIFLEIQNFGHTMFTFQQIYDYFPCNVQKKIFSKGEMLC